jgi:hypothetical protein
MQHVFENTKTNKPRGHTTFLYTWDLYNLFFTFTAKLIKNHVNIRIWNCKDEAEFLTPKLNMTLKLFI